MSVPKYFMMKKNIAEIVVDLPVSGPFDYIVPVELQESITLGMRVQISFNRRLMVGFVVGFQEKSSFGRLNAIISLLDEAPVINRVAMQLSEEVASQYGCSVGQALAMQLPLGLRKKTKVRYVPEHERAVKKNHGEPKIALFHDVGYRAGWQELFVRIQEVLTSKKSVLILVPEVAMVQQTKAMLQKEISAEIFIDQKGTQKQTSEYWCTLKQSNPVVVIGTRSSVFAPISPCGLIVVVDEDRSAFKEEQSPSYQTRDVALMRTRLQGCNLVFLSSCPSPEIWYQAHKYKWEVTDFGAQNASALRIVDLTNFKPGRNAFLMPPLQMAIRDALEQQKRILIFMNRRGYFTMTRCNQCGFALKCERCDVHLTYIESKKEMVCCRCNFKRDLPKVCPSCNGSYLRSMGVGVEKLVDELSRFFTEVDVGCFDSDGHTKKNDAQIVVSTQSILMRPERNDFDIIVHIDFDSELYRFDYKNAGRTFSLLMTLKQMAKESLWVQTAMSDNYCLRAAQKNDWNAYYAQELELREEIGVTPFKELVSVHMRGEKEDVVFEQCQILYQLLNEKKIAGIDISDPYPDVKPKLRDKYRFVLTLKGTSAKMILTHLKPVLKEMKKKRGVVVTLNVDV